MSLLGLTPSETLWAVAIATLLLSLLLFVLVSRWLGSWRGSRGRSRGVTGERRAERLLTKAGYRVVDRQVAGQAHVFIDGRRYGVTVHADLAVERDGKRYLVEVKTGQGRRATIDTTRRQLLEYAQVFGAQEQILVDADAGAIHTIRFDYD